MHNPITLLIPEKTDIEFEQVLATWTNKGGLIKRLGKYWIKDDELARHPIAIYGNQTFALVLAQIYDVALLSPDDSLIARLENKWVKRNIALKEIGELRENDFPAFIKPVIPKIFAAGVFQTLSELKKVTSGLKDTEEILLSNIVDNIQAEARSYIMDGVVADIALYEGAADLVSGRDFLMDFIKDNKDKLPRVVVVDIAFTEKLGWFVLEFNACWGAGLNNCSADKVMECIIGATINQLK
jgi:hypothetical protein